MPPRIRTLKPQFWEDQKVMALTRDERLLFIGLVTQADDQGRLVATPGRLLGQLYVGDEDVTPAMVRRWRDALVEHGLVGVYRVDGIEYAWLPNWAKHQRISRPTPSPLPPPPGMTAEPLHAPVEEPPAEPFDEDPWSDSTPDPVGGSAHDCGAAPRTTAEPFTEPVRSDSAQDRKGREGRGVTTGGAADTQPKRSRGTRLPDDWQPTESDVQYARERGITDVARLAEEFRTYWHGESGSRAVKVNWSATFKNRVLQVAGNGQVRPFTGGRLSHEQNRAMRAEDVIL